MDRLRRLPVPPTVTLAFAWPAYRAGEPLRFTRNATRPTRRRTSWHFGRRPAPRGPSPQGVLADAAPALEFERTDAVAWRSSSGPVRTGAHDRAASREAMQPVHMGPPGRRHRGDRAHLLFARAPPGRSPPSAVHVGRAARWHRRQRHQPPWGHREHAGRSPPSPSTSERGARLHDARTFAISPFHVERASRRLQRSATSSA